MRKLFNFLSLSTLVLLALSSTAQAATHYNDVLPFSESKSPSFSGFYGNLGLDYNMLSSGVDYAGTISPSTSPTPLYPITPASGNKSNGAVSGLLKFGYAFRIQPKIYVGLAGFYNIEGAQTLTSFSTPYVSGTTETGVVNVKETAGSSYGFLFQPGYILNNNKSAIYLNLGMEFTPVTVKTSVSVPTLVNDVSEMSTTKSLSNVKLGIGYQQQLNLGKLKDSNNLTWFAEANYLPSTSVNITQGNTDLAPFRYEEMKTKLGNTQLVVGINYYF